MNTNKALIIDDGQDFFQLLKFYLSKKGFDCFYSYNLEEALELIKLKQPDLIIADKGVNPNIEELLHEIINADSDYDPDVYLIGADSNK